MTTTTHTYSESSNSTCTTLVGLQQQVCGRPVFLVDGKPVTARPQCFDCTLVDVYVGSAIISAAKFHRQDAMIQTILKGLPQVIRDFYFMVSSKMAKEDFDASLGRMADRVAVDPYSGYRLPFKGMQDVPISDEKVTVGMLVGFLWKASSFLPSDLRKSEGLIMAVQTILPDKVKAAGVEQLRTVHDWITDPTDPTREKVLKEAFAMIVERLEDLTMENVPVTPNAETTT